MSDDFKRSGQWASGTGIAQASEDATAIVYYGPSMSDLIQAVSVAVSPAGSSLGRLSVAIPQLVASPPIAPALPLARKDLLGQLKQILESEHVAVLKGDAGSGRSELARSYTENLQQVFWLDLEANAQLPPSLALELFLQNLAGVSVSQAISASLCDSVPTSSVLVIENVSQAVNETGFLARLGQVISGAEARGYFVILSAIHPLPNPLKRLVPEVGVGRFSKEDVRELLSMYGAPDVVVRSGINNLVWGLTHGMPDLVEAILRSLSRRKWKLDSATMDDLLRSNYSSDLRASTQRLLRATESEDTRELLYRLTLLNRAFSEAEALEIAGIMPSVAKPLEVFQGVVGTWLHHANPDRWRTSPLLNGMGQANLDRSIIVAVHSLAAYWILKDQSINQYSAAEAITHLVQAERYNEAANILIQALQGLMEEPVDADAGLLLALWSDMPLPAGIGHGLRLFIRALQVANALRRKRDYRYSLADMTALVASATEAIEHVGAFTACLMVAYHLVNREPSLSLPFISLAASNEKYLPTELREVVGDHSPIEIFWAAAMKIEKADSVEQWLEEVNKLPPEQIEYMMQTEFAADSAAFMFDRLWMQEQLKEQAQRNWLGLLQFLDRSDRLIANWKAPLIAACILRARQAIRIVHTGNIAEALSDGERFYSENERFETAGFLVAAGTATWLIDMGRWDLAAVWLTRAYPFQGPRLALYRFQNAIRYGEMLFRQGAPIEIPFEVAVSLSSGNEDLGELNHLEAKGELATYYYKTQQIDALYREWSTVVQEVLKNRHKSKRWKHFFVLVANHTAYFSGGFGRPTLRARDVAEPALGMFIGDLRDLSDRYSEGVVFLQAGAMAQFADGLGKAREAYEWAIEAAELGATASKNTSAEHFLTQAIPFDIQEKRYALALEHAIRAARGFASRQPLELSEEVRAERQQEGVSEPDSMRDDFSHFAPVNLGLIPVLIDIAAGAEQNPALAREAVLSVLDICRSQHESCSDPLMWAIAVDALEHSTESTFSISAFSESNLGWSVRHREERQILWAYAAVIAGNSSPRELWLAQGQIARWISDFYRHLGNLGRIVCASIAQMWLARIIRTAYMFRLPQYTAKRIKEAAEEVHLGKILLAVSESLDLNLSEEYREVLSSCVVRRSD